MQTVAFIGLGNMGRPMAEHLTKAGHRVIGYDPSPEAMQRAADAGIAPAASAEDAVLQAEVVFTMLPAAQFVREVWENLVTTARPDTLLVDCSTIDVMTARDLHALAASHNLLSVDAPVSGGVGGAAAASLTFMIGGSEEAMFRVRPLLMHMGKKVVVCGEAGTGQAAKICNNMILGISIVAVSEAFVLAERLGLSHRALFEVVSTSSGQCWALTTYCPVPGVVSAAPSNNGYKPGAAATMLLKDLRLSQEAAKSVASRTPLGKHTTEIYESFVADGHGNEDFSAIIRWLR